MSGMSSTSDMPGMTDINGTAELLARVEAAQQQGEQALAGAPTTAALKTAEAELFGRKSALAQLNTSLRDLAPEDRKLVGQAVNDARSRLISALANKKADLDAVDRARAPPSRSPRPDRVPPDQVTERRHPGPGPPPPGHPNP